MLAPLLLLFGAAQADAVPEPEPEALVAGFVDAYNRRDHRAIEAALAPNAKWYSVAGGEIAVEGADGAAIAAWIRNYLERSCTTCRSELVSIVRSGRFVSTVERAEWTGADGRCLSQSGPAVYEVAEGRIHAVWYFPASNREPCAAGSGG